MVTSENQEILINGEVVGEVAYYDSKQNALVVELMSGKEVCILLDTPKSHIQQIETRAQIENLTTVAA